MNGDNDNMLPSDSPENLSVTDDFGNLKNNHHKLRKILLLVFGIVIVVALAALVVFLVNSNVPSSSTIDSASQDNIKEEKKSFYEKMDLISVKLGYGTIDSETVLAEIKLPNYDDIGVSAYACTEAGEDGLQDNLERVRLELPRIKYLDKERSYCFLTVYGVPDTEAFVHIDFSFRIEKAEKIITNEEYTLEKQLDSINGRDVDLYTFDTEDGKGDLYAYHLNSDYILYDYSYIGHESTDVKNVLAAFATVVVY